MRTAALDRCVRELASRNIDLARFGPDDVADDVRDLALTAGIDGFDIRMYGDRGTTLASALWRRTPGLAHAAILTSPVPPNVSRFDHAELAEGALRTLFRVCGADAVCSKLAPDLEDDTAALRADLARAPRSIVTPGPDGHPLTVLVDTDRAAEAIWFAFHDDAVYGLMPSTIRNKAYEQVAAYLVLQHVGSAPVDPTIPSLVWACRHASDESVGSLEAARNAYPQWRSLIDVDMLEQCQRWHLSPESSVGVPPIADRQALVLYGALEPGTDDVARLRTTVLGTQLLPFRGHVSGDRSIWPPCGFALRQRFSIDPSARLPTARCGRTAVPASFTDAPPS